MQINSALSALGNLLAQITIDNPAFAAITEAALAVQSVSAITPDAEGANTIVVVAAQGYADTQEFTFKRLGLADSVATAPTAITLQGTETADQVKAIVSSALNLVGTEHSISATFLNADGSITQPTPAADGTVVGSLVVASNTGSLLYVASASVSLTVNFPTVAPAQPVTPSITSLVTTSNLSGFTAVAAPVAPAQPTDGTTPVAPAGDGTSTQPTDGTTPVAPVAPAAPADGTTPAAPAADGTTGTQPAAGTDGQPAAPAAGTDGQPAAPAADGQAPAATDGTTTQPAAPAADGTGAAPASTN